MPETITYPTIPQLIGTELFLRIATAEDVAQTHHWSTLSDPHLLSFRPMTLMTSSEAAEQFKKQERSSERGLFMAIRKKDNSPVGQIKYFDFNPLNRSAELDLIVDSDLRRKGYGKEMIQLLARYFFRNRDFYKVYLQIGAFNVPAIKLLETCAFRRDGTLRRHHYYQGEFHDTLIYSLLASEVSR